MKLRTHFICMKKAFHLSIRFGSAVPQLVLLIILNLRESVLNLRAKPECCLCFKFKIFDIKFAQFSRKKKK
jgi:hypothetical protein